MYFSRCQLPCSRLIASEDQHGKCVSVAWPMHETLFLPFQIASTVRILRLKPCALDSRFLTENLPFFPSALLRRPPSSVKSRPGVRRREWAVFTFSPSIAWASPRKLSGPVFSWLSCTQPGGTGDRFLRVGGHFIYRGLRL